MASADARITITADSRPAEREIERLANQIGRVQRSAFIPIDNLIRVGSVQKSIETINQLENAVVSLRSRVRSIGAPGNETGGLADSIRTAAKASNDFFDSLVSGQRSLSNTISGLKEQSAAFSALASNINSADARFTDYIQGAQAAQDKGLKPLFAQFRALQKLYEEGVTGRGVEITSGEVGANLFERLSREIPQTEGALKAFSAELQRVRSLISSESTAALGVEQQIIETEQRLLQIEQDRLEVRAALNRELSAPVQGALSRMEGQNLNPFGISGEQINESLNQRAEQYQQNLEEIARVTQSLASMSGKRYDPLGISDEQINAGLNERASQLVQQRNELGSLQQVLSTMEGKKYDPLNISDEQINAGLNERASLYQRQTQELADLQAALGAMQGRKVDPLGISDEQVNATLNQRADIFEKQIRDTEALQNALGSLESRRVNWATALGIEEADIAADKAQRLAVEWNRLQAEADGLATRAPEAAAALRAFKFESLAEGANSYTRALLNQQRTLDEYADAAGRAAAAVKELGYGGELPALRPAGFGDQDVRIKNLIDDRARAADIVADYERKAEMLVNDLEIKNIQKQLDAELDSIEVVLNARKKADEEWWGRQKAFLDQKAEFEERQARQARLPFLERVTGSTRASNAISEGLIGGAFPLLFGQGVGASAGGLIGGVAGGFAGGGLGFGLSLIGTALGTATDEADKLDKELTKVNASIKGVGNTSAEVGRLASNLGIAKEEAVKLLGQFRQFSSAEIRKDLALVFGGGREAILERLESVVKEEDVLQAIIAARKEIGNEEATSLLNVLKIQGGVKAQLVLQDALVRLKEREVIEDKKRITLQDRLLAGLAAAGSGDLVDPKIFGEERAKEQQKIFNQQREQAKKNIEQALKESQEFFREVDKLSETYAEKEKDRKKKEKDNSSQIAAEQARQAEQLARNQIELDNAVFRNRMQLADQEFAARQRIAELQGKLLEAQSFGSQRDIIAFFNEISGIQRSYDAEARQLQQEISRASQELKSANAMISAQQAGTTSISAVGARVAGVGGVTANSVAGYPITSRQGMRRHPVTGAMKMHAGTDIGTPSGTALSYSVGGAVTQATWLDGYGKVLEVQLENGVIAFAAHLNEVLVAAGQKFTANQLLARTGATGVGTGPHLHMEGSKGGDSMAPLPFLRLGGKPSGVMARGQSQVIGAEGDTAVAKANLDSQIAARQKLLPLLQQERNLKVQIAIAEQTQFLKSLQDQAVQMDREIEKRRIRNRLALEGVAPEIIEGEMRVYDILKQRDDKLKELNAQLTELKLVQDKATVSTVEAALADYDKEIATGSLTEAEKAIVAQLEKKLAALKAIKQIEEGSSEAAEATRGIAKESIMSPREKIEGRIGKLKDELAELTNIGNIAISVADGIGNAFGQAFQGLISGSMTAKEALSSFFKSVADTFLSMAAEIIAKQTTMIILQTILKALGAVSGGGGGGAGLSSGFDAGTASAIPADAAGWGASFSTPLKFANGGAFTNSIVSSPTLFKFADGGVTKMGEMGEAGPEAIMPLSRGRGGRLGVDASGLRQAMGPAPGSGGGSPVLSMSFQTTTIGGVEYVSREQLEAAMAETRRAATKDGAKRGMTMTLDRIQNSPSTRRRIGTNG